MPRLTSTVPKAAARLLNADPGTIAIGSVGDGCRLRTVISAGCVSMHTLDMNGAGGRVMFASGVH